MATNVKNSVGNNANPVKKFAIKEFCHVVIKVCAINYAICNVIPANCSVLKREIVDMICLVRKSVMNNALHVQSC